MKDRHQTRRGNDRPPILQLRVSILRVPGCACCTLWYITGVKIQLVSGAALLLATAALFAVEAATQSQKPAKQPSETASQEHKPPSGKASQGSATRKIACKTPENASLCYWTHGRLSVWQGNPPFRIWRVGTHRILAVFSGPSRFPPRNDRDSSFPEWPASLDKAYDAYNGRLKRERGSIGAIPPPAFADFEVCPLEPAKNGEMQAVCIESAKNIVIRGDE